jgi:hypothetical protein
MRLAYDTGLAASRRLVQLFQLARLPAREKVRLHDEKTGRTISSSRGIHISLRRLRVVAAAGEHDRAV